MNENYVPACDIEGHQIDANAVADMKELLPDIFAGIEKSDFKIADFSKPIMVVFTNGLMVSTMDISNVVSSDISRKLVNELSKLFAAKNENTTVFYVMFGLALSGSKSDSMAIVKALKKFESFKSEPTRFVDMIITCYRGQQRNLFVYTIDMKEKAISLPEVFQNPNPED